MFLYLIFLELCLLFYPIITLSKFYSILEGANYQYEQIGIFGIGVGVGQKKFSESELESESKRKFFRSRSRVSERKS